jgi:transcriptional antiterminator NusG
MDISEIRIRMKHGEMAKHTQKRGNTYMWYVMQVRTGTEENICCQCQRLIAPKLLERCFLPHYEQKKRYQGEWHIQERVLFPGYVFLITSDIESLIDKLRMVNGLTKIVKVGDELVALTTEEVAFLQHMGKEEQVVEMSTGIIENDKVKIYQGPLVGLEGSIKKIDRHKRLAWMSLEMFGRQTEIQVGLEILAKVTS